MDNQAQIEGLLFISGDEGISVAELASATGFMKPAVLEILNQLASQYTENEKSALTLLHSGETYRLATKAALAPVMKRYFETPLTVPLTPAILEVLAIIAYKQPITRIEIDEIRGVQSSGSIQKLIMRGLIEAKGRLEVPGQPYQYATTAAFLDYFGLDSLEQLPPLDDELDEESLDGDIFLRALQSRQAMNEESED